MDATEHYQRLIKMYAAAPINDFYRPQMSIEAGLAKIVIALSDKLHHAAGAVHGSVYFKMLDDAAFFAANSLEMEYFLLTTSFTTYLTRPVSQGSMRAVGKVVNQNKTQFIVESVVYDEQGQEIGRGSGLFIRSKQRLMQTPGYLG
ncbi:MAG: PaaI family thioesterase [Polyangiaceae bacterium]|nr:PaaI family thioesterase [Polyangiaceae bacterium]